jgi:tungstate transport system ATP-binding protein
MIVSVDDVWKRFDGTDALRGVSLEVDRGETFALIGLSGSGKTTLLRLIHLLDSPTSGQIEFDGVSTDAPESVRLRLRRRMAMVFQRPSAFRTSVFDNVAYGLKIRGVRGDRLRRRVSQALETVELDGFERRDAHSLSGGELQRVALARSMVTDPDLLLLDEPTANLDPYNVGLIEDIAQKLNRERQTTLVLVTHNVFQARRLAQRVALMLEGRIVEVAGVDDFFQSPRDTRTAAFVRGEMVY